jgi:hypothetical protein
MREIFLIGTYIIIGSWSILSLISVSVFNNFRHPFFYETGRVCGPTGNFIKTKGVSNVSLKKTKLQTHKLVAINLRRQPFTNEFIWR